MQKLSRYLIASPIFSENGKPRLVVFATRTGSVFELPLSTWQTLRSGELDKLEDTTLNELAAAEALVPQDEDELTVMLSRNHEAIQTNTHLNYVIQPTAHCQLGCGYCGQTHEKTNLTQVNEAAILSDVSARLDARDFSELNLCWFGSEPLAGIRQIRSLTPQLRRIADERNVEYRASMITNGLAMSKKVGAELVKQLGIISITVSLDGTAVFHDQRRHTKSGKPTFDRIFANLAALAETAADDPIEIKVRCNVDRQNASDVIPLMKRLHSEGLHRSVQFYTAPIHAWGNDAHLRSLDPGDYAKLELSWFVELRRLGFSVPLVPKVQRVVCLAVQPQAALVDAHGTLFNCTEVSYVPTYGSPNRLALGSVLDGEHGNARDILGSFNDEVAAGKFGCSRCPLLPVCGGACPKEWVEGRAPCPSSKQNMADRLLLAAAFERMDAPDVQIRSTPAVA
jgi:uncharacterized protein